MLHRDAIRQFGGRLNNNQVTIIPILTNMELFEVGSAIFGKEASMSLNQTSSNVTMKRWEELIFLS